MSETFRRRHRPRLAHLDALVAARSRAARGRAERAAARARRRRVRATRLLRLRHLDPHVRRSRRATGPASPTSTRPRCAPPPGRACSPAATTTATAWAASPTSRSAIPGYWGRIPRENGFLPEILRANGYATYAVGKWHLTPDDETHMASSRASWPLAPRLRPLVRVPRRRDASVRAVALPRQPFGAPARAPRGRIPPERRSRRPRDRVPRRPRAPSTPTGRSSVTSRPARATRPTTRRRNGSTATRVTSTADGTRGVTPRSPARSRPASSPRTRSSRRVRTGCRRGTR